MTRRRLVVAGALVAPAVAALPAGAATCRPLPREVTHGAVVRVCQQQAWLHAPSPAGRAGNLAAAVWSPVRPSASLTSGGGAVQVAAPGGAAATFTGTVTGPVDAVAFDLFVVVPAEVGNPSRLAAGSATAMHGGVHLMAMLRLTVDGRALGADDMVWLYRVPDATGHALFRGKVAFPGLYPRTGPAPRQHRLELQVLPDDPKHDGAVFVYDAVEVPSSVTFNPADLSGYSRVTLR